MCQAGATQGKKWRPWLGKVQAFVLKWFLPLGFALSVLIGLTWPMPGAEVSSWMVPGTNYRIVQTINVMTVFFISGLCLKTQEVKQALGREGALAFAFGMVMILGVTPLMGFAAVRLPFRVQEFAYGLAIFCSVPTTIAVGVAMVTQADGNAALALLLTVCSNLMGVLVVPWWLKAFFSGENASVDAVQLLVNLLVTVLAPLLAGQALRFTVPAAARFAARRRTLLKLVSNTSLCLIVWQTISRSADEILGIPVGSLMAIIATGILLHLFYFALAYVPARFVLKLKTPELKACVIMSSEKTLPVSIAVIGFLTTLGSEGLLTIPPIVCQQAQLFIDAFIATRWAHATAGAEEASLVTSEAEPASGGDGERWEGKGGSVTDARASPPPAAPSAEPPAGSAAV